MAGTIVVATCAVAAYMTWPSNRILAGVLMALGLLRLVVLITQLRRH